MRKILVVAVREYQAALRTKSFLVSMAILPLMIGGSVLIQVFAQRVEDRRVKTFAVVDRTPGQQLLGAITTRAADRRQDPQRGDSLLEPQGHSVFDVVRRDPSPNTPEAMAKQREELSEQVRTGALSGFLDIGPDVFLGTAASVSGTGAAAREPADRTALLYQSRAPAFDAFPRWAEQVVNETVMVERGQAAGLSHDRVQAILQPVPLVSRPLDREGGEASEAGQLASFLVPAGLMALMFTMILFGGTPLMHGVVEEKMQRIAEVLLGSVRPFPLLLGKLLGMVAVSLTVLAVYLAGVWWAAHHFGFTAYIPPGVLVWFVVFQVLAVLMYGSLFLAIGAACTDAKETQLLVLPVVLLASLPMMLLRYVLQEPNSGLVTALSFFPPVSPMLLVGRQAIPPGLPWWQPLLGVLDVLAATAACVWAAGRIFRVGLLLQGKGARFGDLVRWVFRG